MTRDHADVDRVHGIEFGNLDAKLRDLDFPVTTEELLDVHGAHAIGTQQGQIRLEDVLAPRTDERFGSIQAIREAIVGTIGEKAIGRKGYADRDPPRDGTGVGEDRRTL